MEFKIKGVKRYIKQVGRVVIRENAFRKLEHVLCLIFIIAFFRRVIKKNRGAGLLSGLFKYFLRLFSTIPIASHRISKQLQIQAQKNIKQMTKNKLTCKFDRIPEQGIQKKYLLQELSHRKSNDADPRKGNQLQQGKIFAYVYEVSQSHSQFCGQAFNLYMHTNALNPILFNSLRLLQNQIVQMIIQLFHGGSQCVGNVTSGGSESLVLAIKTYREYFFARKGQITDKPQVIMCKTGHPGINKGCSYFGLEPVYVDFDQKCQMKVDQIKKLINQNTALIIASAPQYPHGVVDPIQDIAKIALEYDIPLHVDAAIGGLLLPFVQRLQNGQFFLLGPKFSKFDFRVNGVSSINADVHKFGYCPKGVSVLLFKNSQIRINQFYSFATWPGGIYISPTILGSRNGGPFAGAWASLLSLGKKEFTNLAQKLIKVVRFVKQQIKQIKGLQLMAEPHMSILSFTSRELNIYKISDAMQERGWNTERQSNPQSLHCTFMPQHIGIEQKFIQDLKQSVQQVRQHPQLYQSKSKATYGLLAKIPDQNVTQQFMKHLMDKIYKFN